MASSVGQKEVSGWVSSTGFSNNPYVSNEENSSPVSKLAQKGISSVVDHQNQASPGKPRSYVFPSLTSFNLDAFLSPKNFPRNIEDGKRLLEKTTDNLAKGMQELLEIPGEKRTFENTAMAYHDLMTSCDTAERLIRSERLIPDQEIGKAELLDQFIQLKDKIFADPRVLRMFISFADKMITSSKDNLSPAEWQYLKNIIDSIAEKNLPSDLLETWKSVQWAMGKREGASYAYLKGNSDSKVLKGPKKEVSFLTANLCVMPEASSMIYGGLIPWPVRIDAISEELKLLDPDILFLQEVYDVHALYELHKRLAPSYAHFYGNVPLRLFGLSHQSLLPSSGIAVISKFKLENVRFEPYATVTHEDRPSGFDRLRVFGFDRNYGIFHCDVKNGEETLAHIATTHENPFYADVREKQTGQIVESFAKEFAKHPERPLLLCGDLNIERGDLQEGGERLINENFVDHYSGEGPTWFDFGNYWHNLWHPNDQKSLKASTPWTVDRSLLWSPWASKNAYSMQVERVRLHEFEKPELALTDHHGLMTRFTL